MNKTFKYKVGDKVLLLLDNPKYEDLGCRQEDNNTIFTVEGHIYDNTCYIERGHTLYIVHKEMLRPVESQLMFDFMYE